MQYLVLNITAQPPTDQAHRFFLVCELRPGLLASLHKSKGIWPSLGCRVVRDDAQVGDTTFASSLEGLRGFRDLLDGHSVGLVIDADWTNLQGFAYPPKWDGQGLKIECEPTSKGYCQVAVTLANAKQQRRLESSVMQETILKKLAQGAVIEPTSPTVGRATPYGGDEQPESGTPEEIAESIISENRAKYVIPSFVESTLFDEVAKAAADHPDDPRGQALERFFKVAESFEVANSGSSHRED